MSLSTENVDPQRLLAFKTAVLQYKPWHHLHHGAPGQNKDSFPQIINGGIAIGLYDAKKGAELFNVPETQFNRWAEGTEVPDRHDRKKAWTKLRSELGIRGIQQASALQQHLRAS